MPNVTKYGHILSGHNFLEEKMKQLLRFGSRFSLLGFFASATLALTTQQAFAGDLVIHIINEKNVNGIAFIAIQPDSEADEFPDGKAFFAKTVAMAPNSKTKFVVSNIPPGTYAANGFLDTNGNEKLDFNLVGAPTEPYGFSKDARGLFGPPSFADAAFVIKNDNTRIRQTIKLF